MMSAPWIMLDGLLLYGMGELLFGRAWQTMASSSDRAMWAAIPLPVDTVPGKSPPIYHASCSRFDAPSVASTSFFQHFSTENIGDLSSDALKQRYMIVGGEFKQSSKTYPVISSKSVKFWCHGDAKLITTIISAMPGIGKKLDVGYGRILFSHIDKTRVTWAIIHPEYGLNRPIPLEWASKNGFVCGNPVATVAFSPPYWMQEHHEPCYVPGGFA